MDITAVNRNSQALPALATAIPVDTVAQSRPLIQAVKALNGTEMFGEDNELVFQRDPQTQRMIVRVVNRKTREVVSQVPAEYVLRLAADFKRK